MDRKTVLRIMIISFLIPCLFFHLSCSLIESDEKKAEKFYQLGLKALEDKKTDEAIIQFKNAVQKNPAHTKAHYQLGKLYIKTKQLSSAVKELTLAIKQDPNLNEAKRTLALLYFQNRHYSEAIPLCKELIESTGKDAKTLLILANSLVNTKNLADAKRILLKAVKTYPNNSNAKMSLARTFLLDNQPKEARKIMEEAADITPKEVSTQILLARFYEKMGLYDLAEQELMKMRDYFPEKSISYLAPARFLMGKNRLDESERLLKDAIGKGVKDPALFHTLGLVQHRQKKTQDALKSFKEAVDLFPDDQKSSILLADYYIFLKNPAQARATYEKMAEKWPELLPVKSKIAELLLAERRYDEALKHIEGMVEEHSDYARGHILRGILWMKEGESLKAREEFSKARDLDLKSPEGHYYYGLTFLDDKDYKISLSEILQALERKPDSIKIRLALSYVYAKTGKTSLAIEELDKILEAQPGNLKARLLRIEVNLRKRNYKDAALDCRYILQEKPDLLTVQFRLAEIYHAQGKLDEALKGFQELLESYPDPIKPLEKIVRIYVAKGQYGKAINLCDDYLKRSPKDLKVGLIKAVVFLWQKKYGMAEKLVSELIAENPESDQPLMLMAKIYESRQDYASELEMYRRAIEVNPKNVNAHMKMARIYNRMGDFKKAMTSYEEVLKINNSYGPAANDLAYLYADMNQDLDRALDLAKKARELMPKHPDVADTLGFIYLKKGALVAAKNYFREAIKKMPLRPLFHYHLGMTFYQEQNFPDAIKEFQEAIKLGLGKKESEEVRKLLKEMERPGYQYTEIKKDVDSALKNKDLDRALAIAKKAHGLMPEDPDVADTLGWIYLKRGSFLMAKKYFHEAIKGMPLRPLFHYHLGMVFYQEQNFPEAIKAFNEAIKLGLGKKESEEAEKLLHEMKD